MSGKVLLPSRGGAWIKTRPGGIDNFDNVFDVWHYMEGYMNLNDTGGYPAFIGIHKRYNPTFFSENAILLKDWKKNAGDLVIRARDYLRRVYWEPIKARNSQDRLIQFFYKRAWVCGYTRQKPSLNIAVESYLSPVEFSLACAGTGKLIGFEGVWRRVYIYNYAFGAQIPL